VAADGEAVLVHDAVARAGLLRRRRVATTPAADLAPLGVPRLAELYEALGADYELSLDLYEPKAARAVVMVARAFGAAPRLWLCSSNLGLLCELAREAPDVHLVHSTKRNAIGVPLERHAARLAETGIGTINLHRTEWTTGLVGLFHRFGIGAFGWDAQEARHLRQLLEFGIDGLYSDHVDRMVAVVAEWR
jgi:glycerophosphoryl diester phosphodiesterase